MMGRDGWVDRGGRDGIPAEQPPCVSVSARDGAHHLPLLLLPPRLRAGPRTWKTNAAGLFPLLLLLLGIFGLGVFFGTCESVDVRGGRGGSAVFGA